MDLRDYLRIWYANWALIIGATLLGVAAAAVLSYFATPEYQSRAQLYVSVRADSRATGDLLQGSNFAQQSMSTFAELATTQSVLAPAVEALELDRSTVELADQLIIATPTDSTLLTITALDEDPELAANIANEVGAQLKLLVEEDLEAPEENDQASPVQVNIVEPATVPSEPVSPHVPLNLIIGLVLGFAVGAGIAIFRHVLDTRIRSVEDIEAITPTPILGKIPDDPQTKKKPLIVHSDPKHPRAEAIRTLRTNLQFLDIDEGPKSYVISSAGPGEGKSTTSANLAIALADSGHRVALVDGDVRRPRVDEYMGIEGAVGLTDVLIGRTELTDVLQRWGRSELYVLPAGQIPPNPSELLGSDAMEQTLQMLSDSVEIVVIDAPPIQLVTDAVLIGTKTQGVILVVAAGLTQQQNFEAAVEALETAHVPLRGVVTTMLQTRGAGRYAYGGYTAYEEDETAQLSPLARIWRRVVKRLGR